MAPEHSNLHANPRAPPSTAARDVEPRGFVEDAAWLPSAYDAREDALTFSYLPRATQRRVVFLDPRFVGKGGIL